MFGDVQFPESFLSPPVISILYKSSKGESDQATPNSFISSSLTFKWEQIAPFFSNFTVDQQTIVGDSKGIDEKVVENLWKVFCESGQRLKSCECPPAHLWRWTNSDSLFLQCFEEIRNEHNSIIPLKLTLVLSSMFEHALGNVFSLNGKCVPFLLRDLLSSEELLTIFGSIPVKMAQVLLGTPHAFNIRNVCWHGFPAPEEIHMDIPATLMVLICSFGEILDSKGFNLFPSRRQVTGLDWELHLNALQLTGFPNLTNASSDILRIIQECPVIPQSHKKYWLIAVTYFKNGRYAESLLLLLPALEHLLRCLFCFANSCPNRILLAEQHVFYTTLDEILANYLVGADGCEVQNLIRTLLGEKLLEMLLDVFNYVAGPRIRDRMSHGECDLMQIPEGIVNHLLCVSMLIVGKVFNSSRLEQRTDLIATESIYLSKFHPVSLLVKQIHAVLEKLKKLKLCSQKACANPNVSFLEVSNIESVLLELSLELNQSCSNCSDVSCIIEYYLKKGITTLYRCKSDLIVITSLLKICSNLEHVTENCYSALQQRIQLHSEHKLRSRQRRTYSRMLEYLSSFESMFNCMVLMVLIQLHALPQRTLSFRCMKNILKYIENMASLSCLEKNRWEEMKDLTVGICCELFIILNTAKAK